MTITPYNDNMPNNITILGSGKIPLSALAPTISESTNYFTIVIARNPMLIGINECHLDGAHNTNYPIMVADEKEASLSEFINRMKQQGVKVGVVSSDSDIYTEAIKAGDGKIWFSACREGLYLTYLPLLEKAITKPTHIFVFDNDQTIVDKARALCSNPNIYFHKCIVHSVCSSIDFNYDEQVVHLMCGKECFLVFPPDAISLASDFKTNPLFRRSEIKFTDSENAFYFYTLWKPVGINALHTLASVKAYVEGTRHGYSLVEISNHAFADFVSESGMLDYLIRVYSRLYDKMLNPYAEAVQASKDTYIDISAGFIKGLYRLNELIGRGLDPSHSSFDSKIERHFPILRESDDAETMAMLDSFLTLCKRA